MFNLTDLETPILRLGAEFTDPAMFAAMETEQDTQVVAHQPPTNQPINDTTRYLNGRWVDYTPNGYPINIG